MYIFDYFFQRGHFKGSSKKEGTPTKTLERLTMGHLEIWLPSDASYQ